MFEKPSTKYSQEDFEKVIIEPWQGLSPSWDDLVEIEDENGNKVFSKEQILLDKKKLKEKTSNAFSSSGATSRKESMLSDDFEYILMECFNDAGWFSENVTVSIGSIYDDWFNGIDFVLCFREEDDLGQDKYHYLAVDATISTNPDVLAKKVQRDFENIDKGRLNIAKYFINDDDPSIAGTMEMPHIVLMAEPVFLDRVKRVLYDVKISGYKNNKSLESFKKDVFDNLTTALADRLRYAKERLSREKDILDPMSLKKLKKIVSVHKKILQQVEKNKQ